MCSVMAGCEAAENSTGTSTSACTTRPRTRAGRNSVFSTSVRAAAPATTTPMSTTCFMERLRSERRDLPEQLDVVTPGPELRLDVAPAQDALLVDQEIRALGEEPILEQDPVHAAHLALEVAQQILPHRVLRLVLLERRHRIHADREHDRAGALERVMV